MLFIIMSIIQGYVVESSIFINICESGISSLLTAIPSTQTFIATKTKPPHLSTRTTDNMGQSYSYNGINLPAQNAHTGSDADIQPRDESTPPDLVSSAISSMNTPLQRHSGYNYVWVIVLGSFVFCLVVWAILVFWRHVAVWTHAQQRSNQLRKQKEATENYVLSDSENHSNYQPTFVTEDIAKPSGPEQPHVYNEITGKDNPPTIRQVAPSWDYSRLFSGWRQSSRSQISDRDQPLSEQVSEIYEDDWSEIPLGTKSAARSYRASYSWGQIFETTLPRGSYSPRSRNTRDTAFDVSQPNGKRRMTVE